LIELCAFQLKEMQKIYFTIPDGVSHGAYRCNREQEVSEET